VGAVGVLLGALLWSAVRRPSQGADPSVGRPLPELALQDETGRAATLGRLDGTVTVVNVWASWCAPCIEELPSLQALHAQLGGEGLRVVGISVDDDPAEGRLAARKLGVTYPVLYDPAGNHVYDELDIEGLPTTFVVSRDGRVTGVLRGIADYATPQAVAHFREMLRP
jgi:peroxiredoxin